MDTHPHRRHNDAPLLPEAPMFARARNDDNETTELRSKVSKFVMGVIDAEWMARGSAEASRNSVVNEILEEWAAKKWHAASVILKLNPSNPHAVDKDLGAGI